MATWYTDNINGNDTTGNGTIATPYKTILAAWTVASSNDTINVAGSGFSDIPGTLTLTHNSASITTSQDLTTILPIGTVFFIKDPVFGDRKIAIKVLTITATTITVGTLLYYATGSYTAEKLITNHYFATTTNNAFEVIGSNLVRYNVSINGGWINNFTEQTGYTAFVYRGTGTSGTAISLNAITLIGLISFDGFLFAGMTPFQGSFSSYPTVNLNNIRITSCNATTLLSLMVNSLTNFGINVGRLNILPSYNLTKSIEISDIYVASSTWPSIVFNGGFVNQYNKPVTINNLWVKNTNIDQNTSGKVVLGSGVWNIKMLNIENTLPTNQSFTLGGGGYITLRDINYFGLNTTTSPFYIRQNATTQVQVIMPTKRIDTAIPYLSIPTQDTSTIHGYPCMVKDMDGDKLITSSGAVIYSDASEYSTGSNSLKIRKSYFNNSIDYTKVDISSFYMPDPAITKTIVIRMKAVVNSTVTIAVDSNGMWGSVNGSIDGIPSQNFNITNSWADYTFTQLQVDTNYNKFAGSYVSIAISMVGSMASDYVWIDSVTIS